MATAKRKDREFKIEIGLDEKTVWSDAKLTGVKSFIKKESAKRSPEQKRKNEFLAIRYQMEDYVQKNKPDKIRTIDTFVKSYLAVLNVSFKQFAVFVGTTDGNLKKYVSGERKFNPDLAMKFGHVFNTSPDIWLRVQIKNELWELRHGKQPANHYKKYNVEKLLKLAKR
jgi:addiction module HigA family antidote